MISRLDINFKDRTKPLTGGVCGFIGWENLTRS